MAKKRRRPAKRAAKAAARAASRREVPAEIVERVEKPTAEEPAFWFGFEVSAAKLVLGRIVLFALLAIDSLVQIAHAPRYGAGDFNVAQLPFLDSIGPTRALYSIGQLVLAYLFVFAACGVATRIVLPIAAALYGWLYFGSQLDSYQHHYLVWLVLVLACAVPWQRPAGTVRSWALRLILVQLGIVYVWAAISKLDGAWLDGSALAGQLRGGVRAVIDATVGLRVVAWVVIIGELVLAATVWCRRAWPIAAPLGIGFHIAIMLSGLEIGLFAWLMLGLYVFVVPDRVWSSLAALWRWPLPALRWLVVIPAIIVAPILWFISRFDHGRVVGAVLFALVLVAAIAWRRRISIAALAGAHLLALATWTIVDRSTSTAADYYRFWGGSARRLGDATTAETAYRKMTEVAPREAGGHYHLGKLLLQRGASDEGLAELRRAQDLEPLEARAYVAEARWLAEHGRRDEAIEKAREAAIVEPSDNEARSLLDSLLATP